MAQEQINLRLDPGLIARIDDERGDIPRNRWILRAVERALDVHNKTDDGASVGQPLAPAEQPVTAEVGSDFDLTAPLPAEKVKDLRKRVRSAKRAKTTQAPSKDLPSPPAASQGPTGASKPGHPDWCTCFECHLARQGRR